MQVILCHRLGNIYIEQNWCRFMVLYSSGNDDECRECLRRFRQSEEDAVKFEMSDDKNKKQKK